jgi:hypothetical protein
MRNYIFPDEFTPVFDYCLLEGPDCWGWVNQGFVNVVGAVLCAQMPGGIGFFVRGCPSRAHDTRCLCCLRRDAVHAGMGARVCRARMWRHLLVDVCGAGRPQSCGLQALGGSGPLPRAACWGTCVCPVLPPPGALAGSTTARTVRCS